MPTKAKKKKPEAKCYNFLNSPDKFTKGAFARDCLGKCVNFLDENAKCWCASGIIRRLYSEDEYVNIVKKFTKAVEKVLLKHDLPVPLPEHFSIPAINDWDAMTWDVIREIFKKARI